MVLVFILLSIFIILLLLFFILLLSTLHIEIKDLKITNMETNNKSNYAIIISLYLGKYLKWISVHLNDKKLRKAYSKMQLEKVDLKKLEKNLSLEDLKAIKKLQPKISYLRLMGILGTENAAITAFITSAICILISIILPHFAADLKKDKYQYHIEPVYKNQNLYKIKFNCIIQVKMVHIINVIISFLKKGRSDLNERATSNRRAYGYSHE